MSPLIVLDLETTALEPEAGGIWDIGCVAVQDGKIVATFETLVWPGRDCLQPEHLAVIQKVSQIAPGDALLRLVHREVPEVAVARSGFLSWAFGQCGAPPARKEPYLAAWCKPCEGRGWFPPGQNGAECRFCAECRGHGRLEEARTPVRMTSFNVAFDARWLIASPWQLEFFVPALGHAVLEWAPCLMAAAAHRLGIPGGRVKLTSACERLGVEFRETHRASADAEAAAKLAIKLGVE